jgi:hypothetical protein
MNQGKSILLLTLFVFAGLPAEAQTLTEMFEGYMANQKKIKTFIGMGETKVEMYNNEGVLINSVRSPMQIFMKYPDLFKIVMTGNEQVEMVQKGSVITQRTPGANTVVTQTVDERSDLFKKYFGYTAVGKVDERYVESVQAAGDGIRFRVRLPQQDALKIDFIDYFFNDHSLLTGSSIYVEGKEYVRTYMTYVLREGVYVADEIRTEAANGSAKIISVIKYGIVNVNMNISDREFALK